jgi:hypothetical protein
VQQCSNCAFAAVAALQDFDDKLLPGKCSCADNNGTPIFKSNGGLNRQEVLGVRFCKKCKTTWNGRDPVKIDLTVFITPWDENNVLLPPGWNH